MVTRRCDVMRRQHRHGATPALIVEPPPRYALGCGLLNDAPSSRKRWEAVLSAPLPLHVATGFSLERSSVTFNAKSDQRVVWQHIAYLESIL